MGQSEPVRAQFSTLSTCATMKPCWEMPSFIEPISSLPFESALLPFVDESHHEDSEEDEHCDETEPADVLQDHRPGKEEGDLQVEEDEEDRHEVVAHVELHARVLESLEAALVRREFRGLGILAAGEPRRHAARHDAPDSAAGADDQEQQDWKIVSEQFRQSSFKWCRRRDSNSYAFRHCPLKTACLPIPPRRHLTRQQ